MNLNALTDAQKIKLMLDYNPATGVLTRKFCLSNRVKPGDVAGTVNAKGAVVCYFDGKLHYAHRLAWLWFHGEWPHGVIDHINGDPTDNRIENLRDVPQKINMQNQRRERSNKSGLLGVWKKRGKWVAAIKLDGRPYHLGSFQTAEGAHEAYVQKKRELHPGGML